MAAPATTLPRGAAATSAGRRPSAASSRSPPPSRLVLTATACEVHQVIQGRGPPRRFLRMPWIETGCATGVPRSIEHNGTPRPVRYRRHVCSCKQWGFVHSRLLTIGVVFAMAGFSVARLPCTQQNVHVAHRQSRNRALLCERHPQVLLNPQALVLSRRKLRPQMFCCAALLRRAAWRRIALISTAPRCFALRELAMRCTSSRQAGRAAATHLGVGAAAATGGNKMQRVHKSMPCLCGYRPLCL